MSQENNNGYAVLTETEAKHYDRVPSIIDHLTYIEESTDEESGKTTFIRKRLTPTEKELYRILRYRAGENKCWRNVHDLASHVGCAPDTITAAKRTLSMPFEQLEGNPLIHIEEKMILTKRDGKNINKRPVHIITIGPVWIFNNAFMANYYEEERTRKFQKELNEKFKENGMEFDPLDEEEVSFPRRKVLLSLEEAELAIEKMGQQGKLETVHNLGPSPKKRRSFGPPPKKRRSSPGGSSQNQDVNNNKENNSHCLRTDPTAEAVARCFFKNENVEDCFGSEASSFDALQRMGFSHEVASRLVKKPIDELLLSAIYVKEKLENNKITSSITGYFLRTLENKWYQAALY